jgi:type IV pilus assembly protein PilA
MVTVAIVGILASVALSATRDYTRRASISEVVLATSTCKQAISENYATLTDAPAAGHWGCEAAVGTQKHVGKIETSADGVIRIAIANLDGLVNGRYVHMIPVHADGVTPMVTPDDMGLSVVNWRCGSDWMPVRNALPANCRNDTTTYASQDFN